MYEDSCCAWDAGMAGFASACKACKASYGEPELDAVEEAQAAKAAAACSCGEPWVGSLVQCDRHHGVGCNCLACVA